MLYVVGWTAAILAVTTVVYALGPAPSEGWDGGALYYSVVTFVTSPPHPPPTAEGLPTGVIRTVVLLETYLGTALIILLGYVLSNRDRL